MSGSARMCSVIEFHMQRDRRARKHAHQSSRLSVVPAKWPMSLSDPGIAFVTCSLASERQWPSPVPNVYYSTRWHRWMRDLALFGDHFVYRSHCTNSDVQVVRKTAGCLQAPLPTGRRCCSWALSVFQNPVTQRASRDQEKNSSKSMSAECSKCTQSYRTSINRNPIIRNTIRGITKPTVHRTHRRK